MNSSKTPRPRIFITCMPSAYDRLIGPRGTAVLESFATVDRNMQERLLSDEEMLQRTAQADGIIVGWPGQSNALSKTLIDAAGSLRIVGQLGQSIKQIDTDAVFARGLALVNSPSAFANAVAEFTLAMMLGARHRLPAHDRAMRMGTEAWGIKNASILGRELCGATVGLIGLGWIGKRVAHLLAPFQVELLVHDPYAAMGPDTPAGVRFTSLDELLTCCDIVSVHAALTQTTTHMIGRVQLEQMKMDALLVNTARGGLVHEEALIDKLQRCPAFMAALDVFASEPLAPDSPLRTMDNVLLSSHRSGHTVQAYEGMGTQVIEDFQRFFAGQALRYRVTAAQLSALK